LFKALIIASLMLSITACAVTPKKTPSQLKQEGNIHVMSFSTYSIVNVIPFTPYTTLRFLEVDGEPYNWSFSEGKTKKTIELTPGRHTLSLACIGVRRGMFYSHNHFNYQINVESGHIYQMVPKFVLNECEVIHKDVTSKYSGVSPEEP